MDTPDEPPPLPSSPPPILPQPSARQQILVRRGTQQFGPYSIEAAKEYLTAGQLTYSDTATFNGANDWQPLAWVLGLAAPPPPVPIAWYKRTGWQVFLLVFFPYVQVPLMWILKLYSARTRVIVTIAACVWLLLSFAVSSTVPDPPASPSMHRTANDTQGDQADAVEVDHSWKKLDRGLFGRPKFTKAEWRASFPSNKRAINGNPFVQKSDLLRVMGDPDRTQTIGDEFYQYWNCTDGIIQVVSSAVLYNSMDGVYVQINDY